MYVLNTKYARPDDRGVTELLLRDEITDPALANALAQGEEHFDPDEGIEDWPVHLSPLAQERLPAAVAEEWLEAHDREALETWGGAEELRATTRTGAVRAASLRTEALRAEVSARAAFSFSRIPQGSFDPERPSR